MRPLRRVLCRRNGKPIKMLGIKFIGFNNLIKINSKFDIRIYMASKIVSLVRRVNNGRPLWARIITSLEIEAVQEELWDLLP